MLTAKQKKIAAAAQPRDQITGADFKALRGKSRPKKDRSTMASAMDYQEEKTKPTRSVTCRARRRARVAAPTNGACVLLLVTLANRGSSLAEICISTP